MKPGTRIETFDRTRVLRDKRIKVNARLDAVDDPAALVGPGNVLTWKTVAVTKTFVIRFGSSRQSPCANGDFVLVSRQGEVSCVVRGDVKHGDEFVYALESKSGTLDPKVIIDTTLT